MIEYTVTTEVKVTYKGTDLVRVREARGLTQVDLAERLGWTHQRIATLERAGQVTVWKDTFEKIMQALAQ
jgi:transcriptional regulator with XRE-family HTH domain